LSKIPTYEEAQNKLDEMSETWQKEIEALYGEVEQLYQDFQNNSVLWSNEMKKKKEEEIIAKDKEAKELQKKYFGNEGELYKKREEVDDALADMLQNFSIRQFLLKNLIRDKNGTFDWKINLNVIDQSIENLVVEISSDTPFQGKTLFIGGDKSDYIRPVDEEQIHELFPNSQVSYLPDVGHWVHAQAPDLLYQTVMDFINSK
jgi:hypothetical protein